jgi:hypothetical protein
MGPNDFLLLIIKDSQQPPQGAAATDLWNQSTIGR